MFKLLEHQPQIFQEEELESIKVNLILENQLLLKSVNHYWDSLYCKTSKCFQENIQKQKDLRMLRGVFGLWSRQIKIRKAQQLRMKVTFKKLRQNIKINNIKYQKLVDREAADNFYQKYLRKRFFTEWKREIINARYSQKIRKQVLLKNQFREFCHISMITISQSNTNKAVDSIRTNQLLKNTFKSWKLSTKTLKLQKYMQKFYFPIFYSVTNKVLIYEKNKYRKYHEQILMKKCLTSLQGNYLQMKAQKYYHKKLLKSYFRKWNSKMGELFYEKQKFHDQEEMISQYINRKKQILLRYYYEKWKKFSEEKVDNRRKISIAKQYYYLKRKEYLLKVCWEALKDYKFLKRADTFRITKLTEKAIQVLRVNCIKSTEKWEKVFKFAENREKRKYFEAILRFNQLEQQKVKFFLSAKYFTAFSLSLVKQYIKDKNLSQSYHTKSLLYKSFYILKKQIQLKKKTQKAIILVHANMPLRRWRKNWRVRQFVAAKQYMVMKKVFLELRLLRYLKKKGENNDLKKFTHSQTKLKQFTYKKNESIISQSDTISLNNEKSLFEFEKLLVDSPQKMFSLQYSRSGYNSNQNPIY